MYPNVSRIRFFDGFFEPLTPPPNTRDLRFWETPHLLFSFGYGLGVAKGCLVGPRGPEIILIGSVYEYNSLPPLLVCLALNRVEQSSTTRTSRCTVVSTTVLYSYCTTYFIAVYIGQIENAGGGVRKGKSAAAQYVTIPTDDPTVYLDYF